MQPSKYGIIRRPPLGTPQPATCIARPSFQDGCELVGHPRLNFLEPVSLSPDSLAGGETQRDPASFSNICYQIRQEWPDCSGPSPSSVRHFVRVPRARHCAPRPLAADFGVTGLTQIAPLFMIAAPFAGRVCRAFID